MYKFNSCLVLVIFYIGDEDGLGGMCVCGDVWPVDSSLTMSFGRLLLLLSYMLYIDVYESCLASCHRLGRGQISVKLTGHA